MANTNHVSYEELKNATDGIRTETDGKFVKKADVADLTGHTSNTTIHITGAERSTWNNKADASNVYTKADSNNLLAMKADLVNGVVPASQLPSFVDDVLEYASTAAFPSKGETGKIYVALDTNLTYRWGGSAYVEISKSLALGETAETAYAGDKGKAATDAIVSLASNLDTEAKERLANFVSASEAILKNRQFITANANAISEVKQDLSDVRDDAAQAISDAAAAQKAIDKHKDDKSNPHGVTAEQVGAYTTTEIDDKIEVLDDVLAIQDKKIDERATTSALAEVKAMIPVVSATDATFSNAVLAVAMNIDTNSVAQINELLADGASLPTSGVVTVGGLLAALAAGLAALKKTVSTLSSKVDDANAALEEVA